MFAQQRRGLRHVITGHEPRARIPEFPVGEAMATSTLSERRPPGSQDALFLSLPGNNARRVRKSDSLEDGNDRQHGNQNTDGGPGKITQHAWHQHHLSLAPGPVERQSQSKLKRLANVPLHLGYVACRTFAYSVTRARDSDFTQATRELRASLSRPRRATALRRRSAARRR
jgi:hypothetical protein